MSFQTYQRGYEDCENTLLKIEDKHGAETAYECAVRLCGVTGNADHTRGLRCAANTWADNYETRTVLPIDEIPSRPRPSKTRQTHRVLS